MERNHRTGAAVVIYTYDAWGKLLETGGSMATTLGALNPLRYRGYVYDTETGLYYLQSRYYDPEVGRFVNADIYVSTGQGMIGNNMFAYCANNPTNGCDPCGTCIHRWDFWNNCEKCRANYRSAEYGLGDMAYFIEQGWYALTQSFSVSFEIGYGIGAGGKLGSASVEATAIIVGDEWVYNSDGTQDSCRKASLTVQAEVLDIVNAGVDLAYSVPLPEGRKKGLLEASGGSFDVTLGMYASNYGIGYNTMGTHDVELSFGLCGYFIMGGGFEVNFNLSNFLSIMNEGYY